MGVSSNQVGQPMAHAWVDSTQRVSSERLRRWTAAEATWSPLAVVVREVLDTLTENPHNPQQQQQQQQQQQANHSTSTFPEVDGLSNDQVCVCVCVCVCPPSRGSSGGVVRRGGVCVCVRV